MQASGGRDAVKLRKHDAGAGCAHARAHRAARQAGRRLLLRICLPVLCARLLPCRGTHALQLRGGQQAHGCSAEGPAGPTCRPSSWRSRLSGRPWPSGPSAAPPLPGRPAPAGERLLVLEGQAGARARGAPHLLLCSKGLQVTPRPSAPRQHRARRWAGAARSAARHLVVLVQLLALLGRRLQRLGLASILPDGLVSLLGPHSPNQKLSSAPPCQAWPRGAAPAQPAAAACRDRRQAPAPESQRAECTRSSGTDHRCCDPPRSSEQRAEHAQQLGTKQPRPRMISSRQGKLATSEASQAAPSQKPYVLGPRSAGVGFASRELAYQLRAGTPRQQQQARLPASTGCLSLGLANAVPALVPAAAGEGSARPQPAPGCEAAGRNPADKALRPISATATAGLPAQAPQQKQGGQQPAGPAAAPRADEGGAQPEQPASGWEDPGQPAEDTARPGSAAAGAAALPAEAQHEQADQQGAPGADESAVSDGAGRASPRPDQAAQPQSGRPAGSPPGIDVIRAVSLGLRAPAAPCSKERWASLGARIMCPA